MKQHVVEASREVVRLLHMQALESYPLEVEGQLIGASGPERTLVELVSVITRYTRRTTHSTLAQVDPDMWNEKEFLGPTELEHVGGWHSHPDTDPVLSRPKDVTAWDRRKGTLSDFEEMEDGDIEWIVSVFPGTRKKVLYRDRCYIRVNDRAYRCKIKIL